MSKTLIHERPSISTPTASKGQTACAVTGIWLHCRDSIVRRGRFVEANLHVLLVDDERSVRDTLVPQLKRAGFEVAEAVDGEEALRLASSLRPDIILLDVILPRLDGREVLRALRRQRNWTPVLMLSRLDDAFEVTGALDEGADDYISKPWNTGELVSRIRAVLRRTRQGQRPLGASRVLRCGDVTFDRVARRVTLGSQELSPGSRTKALLEYLMLHPDEVLSRDRLLAEVWGYPPDMVPIESRAVDQRISELRRLLQDDPARPRFIETESGEGYRFLPEVLGE
jgi:DNA-binding response OmpR family regulator